MKNTNENYMEMAKFIEELETIESAIERHHQKEDIADSIYNLRDANLLSTEEADELLSRFQF